MILLKIHCIINNPTQLLSQTTLHYIVLYSFTLVATCAVLYMYTCEERWLSSSDVAIDVNTGSFPKQDLTTYDVKVLRALSRENTYICSLTSAEMYVCSREKTLQTLCCVLYVQVSLEL